MPVNEKYARENEKNIADKLLLANDNFPCFVNFGNNIEDPATAPNEQEKYGRTARNGLRNLTYGTPFIDSKLLSWTNFKALFIKQDAALLDALREEMQNIFLNVYKCIVENCLQPEAEKRLEIFINNLLSAYPFMDPKQNEGVLLPQKINGHWKRINYHFEKIDISPQSGLLAKLIEEQDRIYAYGLVPITNNAQPYLVFIGTIYPSGQGARLNWLYNFYPRHSIGEGHDLSRLEEWINSHDQIKVVGHSKGGTMAMIVAALYPEKISSADCLHPTALCEATLTRLKPIWKKASLQKKTVINVYAHLNDPIFLLENNFLENTRIFRFGKANEGEFMLTAHAHYFAGRKSTLITEITNMEQHIRSRQRDFVTTLKEILNLILFPLMYIELVYGLCARKVRRYCEDHSTLIKILLLGICISVCAALIATGVFAPLVGFLAAAQISIVLSYAIVAAISGVVSIGATAIVPKLVSATEALLSKSIFAITLGLGLCSALTLGGIVALIKMGYESFFKKKQEQPSLPQPILNDNLLAKAIESTEFILNSLSQIKSELIPPHNMPTSILLKKNKSESDLLRFSFNLPRKENKEYEIELCTGNEFKM